MMFDQFGGYGYSAPPPYYAQPQPVRQQAQPRPQPVAVKPKPKPVDAPQEVVAVRPVVVLPPAQLGISLPDPPVLVPAPKDLGIDLE
jgi:hypothetical protein